MVGVVLGGIGSWDKGEIVCYFGRGFDTREKTREESRKAFCEKVGSNPCFMAEIVACQGRFMEVNIHCF